MRYRESSLDQLEMQSVYIFEILAYSKHLLKDNKNHYHLAYHSRNYLTYIMYKFRIILNNNLENIMSLKGSKTEQNLKDAFAGESQANRRYSYFAAKADVEGQNDIATVFRSTVEGETGHAHGHLEYLEKECGDPATGEPIGDSVSNLKRSYCWRNTRVHRHVPRYG